MQYGARQWWTFPTVIVPVGLALGCLLLSAEPALAQPAKQKTTEKSAKSKAPKAEPKAAAPAPNEAALLTIPPLKPAEAAANRSEHVIYVPYSKLSDVFEKETRNVLLPFAEYQRLWDTVRKLGATITKPPVPAVISDLEYTGTVTGEMAQLKAKLIIDVLADDWVKLPLPFKDAAITKSEGGTLAADGAGGYFLLFNHRGKHTVTLDLTATVTRSPEGRKLVLAGPVAGSTTLELSLPEPGLDVEVAPKLATTQVRPADQRTQVRAVLGATDTVSVAWRGKAQTVVTQALATAMAQAKVSVGDGVVHSETRIDYQLLRGELGEFTLALPAPERVLDVQASGLRDWRSSVEGQTQKLVLRLHAPVKDKLSVRVDSERPIPTGAFAVGTVRALGVQRESGLVAVFGGEEVSANPVERKGVTRVAPAEVPADLQRPGGLYFKYYSPEFVLTLETAPVAPRIAVTSQFLFRLEEGRLRGEATLRYDIQRAGVFAIRIRLPAGSELEEVSSPAMERYELLADPNGQILNLQLKQKTQGALEVRVVVSQARSDANAPLKLPVPEPLDIRSERGQIALLAHESFEVKGDPAQTKGVRPVMPAELAAQNFAVPKEPRMNLAGSFAFLSRPIEVGFTVERRKTRVVADVFTRVLLKENAVLTRSSVVYDVQFAGTDTFELLVPESISKLIEITGPNIKEKRAGKANAQGLVPWTVVLHTRTLGRHALLVHFEEPLKLQEKATSTANVVIKLVEPQKVERENGQIAVSKERSLSVEDKVGAEIEPTDPRRLTLPPGAEANPPKEFGEVQLAYRYYRHPVNLTLLVTKHEIQRVVETVIRRALIDTVVPDEGPLTFRAQYQIQSSQRQRLRLSLPEGAKFRGVNVAGRNVLPEKEPSGKGNDYLINVSRSTGADEPFSLTIVYELTQAPGGLNYLTFVPGTMPKLWLEMPRLSGDIAFQRLFWRVWLPKRYTSVERPTGFTDEGDPRAALLGSVGAAPEYNPEIERWQQDWNRTAAQNVFEFPTVGRAYIYSTLVGRPVLELTYGYIPAMVTAASLAVLAIMLLFLRVRFSTKVTLVLLVGTVLAILSLFDPEAVCRWVSAARLGLGIGLAFWLGRELLVFQRTQLARRATEKAAPTKPPSGLVPVAVGSASATESPPLLEPGNANAKSGSEGQS